MRWQVLGRAVGPFDAVDHALADVPFAMGLAEARHLRCGDDLAALEADRANWEQHGAVIDGEGGDRIHCVGPRGFRVACVVTLFVNGSCDTLEISCRPRGSACCRSLMSRLLLTSLAATRCPR